VKSKLKSCLHRRERGATAAESLEILLLVAGSIIGEVPGHQMRVDLRIELAPGVVIVASDYKIRSNARIVGAELAYERASQVFHFPRPLLPPPLYAYRSAADLRVPERTTPSMH